MGLGPETFKMEEFKASRKFHNSMMINWVLGLIAEMHRKPPTGWVSVTSRSRGEQICRAKPEQDRLPDVEPVRCLQTRAKAVLLSEPGGGSWAPFRCQRE